MENLHNKSGRHYSKRRKRSLRVSSLRFGKNRKKKRVVITIFVIMALVVSFLIFRSQNTWNKFDVSQYSISSNDEETGYVFDEGILTVLLIGVDSTGVMETSATYGNQARADNIDLISFDTVNKSIKILPISRDTMTEVTKFSSKGYDVGTIKTHLGFAYSFGDGGNASSMNVCDAVSNLLYGTEVYKYITTNLDSIAYANDLIGGVTVLVPNDDLKEKYPELTAGSEVELNEENVADFLRYRDPDKDGSNIGRMERQQAFLEAYVKKLETMTEDEYKDMWDRLSSDKSKIRTNISENMFLDLIENLREYKYDPLTDNLKIEGVDSVEDGYDVFYPDEEKLQELVRNTFFKKI